MSKSVGFFQHFQGSEGSWRGLGGVLGGLGGVLGGLEGSWEGSDPPETPPRPPPIGARRVAERMGRVHIYISTYMRGAVNRGGGPARAPKVRKSVGFFNIFVGSGLKSEGFSTFSWV